MKTLQTYIECDLATPANTMGMGNPGEIAPDTLTEPIGTAKSEMEKPKKKKKKIKSLAESLFDDNITKEYVLGDFLELERWENADVTESGPVMSIWHYNFSKEKLDGVVKKSRWKTLLKPFENTYQNPGQNWRSMSYDYTLFYWYFTWVVMCSKSEKDAVQNLKDFIKEIKYSYTDYREEDLRLVKPIEIIPLNGLGDMKDFPRLITFKLHTKHNDYVLYMKLKKRA